MFRTFDWGNIAKNWPYFNKYGQNILKNSRISAKMAVLETRGDCNEFA
jgi:hypothetical protein